MATIVGQRVYEIALGCEELNDQQMRRNDTMLPLMINNSNRKRLAMARGVKTGGPAVDGGGVTPRQPQAR